MSRWHYRVIRKHHPETDSVTYHVHEVYEKAEEALAELYQRAGLLEFDRSSR